MNENSVATASPRLIAAIPAFQEEKSIGKVVQVASQYVDQVLVIDDGSTDDTACVAEQFGAVVIQHVSNQGKAAGITTAIQYAIDHAVQEMVLLDADGQHDPNDIPHLVAPLRSGDADVVVGSRFLEIANPIPYYRTIGQRVLNIATYLGSGVWCSDSQSGYRALSSTAFRCIRLNERFLHGLAVESEMQFEMGKHNLKLAEVPIYVRYDDRPKRSPIKHGFGVLFRVIQITFARRVPFISNLAARIRVP